MTMPAPNLDDRRFQQLVDEAKTLVQQRCPEWTDHNVSDPGVTLIMGGIGVAILGVALIVLVLRMLLAQAVARDVEAAQLRADLDEVI